MAPDWTGPAVDARIYSHIPMSGEGSGLGGPAPALAGCLGKAQEQLASLKNCPWCAAKGLTCALRSYRINLHESIILCTSPQCLFPLVTRPLDDVLASLAPPDPQTGVKRKSNSGETDDPVPSPKCPRAEEGAEPKLQSGDVTPTSEPESTDTASLDKNKHLPLETEVIEGYHKDSDWPVQEELDQEVTCDEEATAFSKKMAATVDPVLSVQNVPSSEEREGKENALSELLETASGIEKTGPFLTEDDTPTSHKTALPSDEAVAAAHETASTSDEAVPPPAEAVAAPEAASEAVPSEQEDEVLSMGEDVQAELPLEAPCSTDERPLRIPDKEEDRLSTALTTPAPDREELAGTEQERCTKVDKPNALDNQEPARQKSNKTEARVKPVLNQGPVRSSKLIPVPSHLFWRNTQQLCWLDSLMVAMVNCRTLREGRPEVKPKFAALLELFETYDEACSLIRDHQQLYQDGIYRVPSSLLQMVTDKMNTQRMSMVNLLQPKLRCKLGQEDTPVFAMPLLLRLDTWAEPQFQLVYRWEFLCCHQKSKNRCIRTLSTFTKVVPDWHPFNAVAEARCGACRKKVTRRMLLERVPPVFALHFEQGLPDTDLSKYSFSFSDDHYSITMVIQYLQQKHFVTWIRKPDGSWLEFDDLKHPDCLTHSKLTIPAHEIHVVFWERETEGQKLHTSPSSNGFTETRPVVGQLNRSLEARDFFADKPVDLLDQSQDSALPVPQDDTGIVEALTVSSDEEVAMDTNVAADSSIGSATLLDAFEGLSHNDIVTLTLVEVMVDSEGRPLEGDGPVPEKRLSNSCKVPQHSSAPGTVPVALESSHELSPKLPTSVVPGAFCGGVLRSEVPSVEITTPATPIPSDKPSAQPLSQTKLDPTPPGVKVNPEEKPLDSNDPVPENRLSSSCEVLAHSSNPDTSPRALESSYESSPERATSILPCGIILPSVLSPSSVVPPVGTPTTPIPSAKPLAPPLLQTKVGSSPSKTQKSVWPHMLSNNPAISHNSTSTPNTQTKPRLVNPSSAIPLRRPPPLKVVKPLRNDDSEALPAKAADRFGGFSVRSTNYPTQPKTAIAPLTRSPPRKTNHGVTQNGSSKVLQQPCGPLPWNPAINTTTATSLTPPHPPGLTELPKISKKNHQSKVPRGLDDTGALRYKLLKKLKAKKKRLEELNQRLGYQGGAAAPGDSAPKPDSTARDSPSAVSSTTSVYDSPVYDQFFADLLSPTTTTSNLSPDSTGFLEKMANGQEGGGDMAHAGSLIGTARGENAVSTPPDKPVAMPLVEGPMTAMHDNFMDEFISRAALQQQTEMETEALNALEMFF